MAKQLTIDEMLELLHDAKEPCAKYYQQIIEGVATMLAHQIALTFDVDFGPATFEGVGMAGTCAPIYQKRKGQRQPELLKQFDPDGEWHLKPKSNPRHP